jgi:hypothetical protein
MTMQTPTESYDDGNGRRGDVGYDRPMTGSTQYRNEFDDTQKVRETKPSLITTEFWIMLGGIAALILAYIIVDDDSLDLFRLCLLSTIAGSAYIISRGLAKSGSRTERRAVR